jgi:hypothetical protein
LADVDDAAANDRRKDREVNTMRHAPRWARIVAGLAAVLGAALLAGCDDNAGVGFSVDLPASYGSMELGLSTNAWVGGPTW